MFKRLRERLAEEATKLPAQYAPFGSSPNRETSKEPSVNKEIVTEDLINLTPESSSIVVPQASPQQFSIAEEEESSFSGQSTPQKKQLNSSVSETLATPQSLPSDGFQSLSLEAHNLLPLYQPPQLTTYVPQSDIESEIEEPPPAKLDGVSKEQLLTAFLKLRSRIHKYKSRYSEVVKAYREVEGEKEKVMKALSESQDKALRRIAELREQCQLEQKAKAHLEENLRIILEEKEEMIHVLETKVKLLKENGSASIHDGDQTDGTIKSVESSPESLNLKPADHEIGPAGDSDVGTLREKVKRLETLLNKCKDTIKKNKDRIFQIMQEKEELGDQLELKSKEMQNIEEKEAEIQATLRAELQQARERLVQLEHQQEDSAMAMAETKRNMHEELELKEKQLLQAKEEALLYMQEKENLEKKVDEQKEALTKEENNHKAAIAELQCQLALTEKTLDEEKQNLMQELSRGKAAAITLMQQECEKKVASTIESWTSKLEEAKKKHNEELSTKEEEYAKSIQEKESELQNIINQKDLNNKKSEDDNQMDRDDLTLHEMTVKNRELEDAICQLHEEIRRQQEKHNETEENMQVNHQKELADTRKAAGDLEEQLRLSQQKVEDLKATICQINEEMKEQGMHSKELELTNQNHQLNFQNAQKTIEELNKQCKELHWRQLLSEKEQALAVAQEDLSAAESKYKDQLCDMEAQISVLQREKNDIIAELQRLANIEADYKNLLKNEERVTKEANSWKEQVSKLNEDYEALKSDSDQKLLTMETKILDITNEKNHSIKDIQDKFTSLEQSYKEMCNSNEDLLKEKDALIDSTNSLNDVIAKHKEESQNWVTKLKKIEEEHVSSVEKYQEEIQLLNRQLDESLLVAEANQGVAYQQVSHLKAQFEESQLHITTLVNEKAAQEAEMTHQVKELQALNEQLYDEIASLKNIQEEKEMLNTRIQQLEEQANSDKVAFKEQLDLLKQDNENLKIDCININNLKQEKDELNLKLCSLEKEKNDIEKKLVEQTELLKLEIEKRAVTEKYTLENEEMQQSCSQEFIQKSGVDEADSTQLQETCNKKQVITIEEAKSQDVVLLQQQLESLHEFYKKKLSNKEDEFNSKLKHLVQNLATEWKVKDQDYDETICNLIEKAREQEDRLARDHRLELAELQQQIFEKDSALEEIQEHYLGQLQEKETQHQNIIQEYKQKFQALQSLIPAGQENNNIEDKLQEPKTKHRTEASDWEDSWAVSEEDVEDSLTPTPSLPHKTCTESSEKQCFLHMQQIKDLQAVLSENQAELADLKCLLGLTNRSLSSQSLNNSEFSLQVPEATEYEYLRNILFEYMMGKEPLILAKVIAAVLRFSADQTQQILQKEEARQLQKL